MKADTRNYGKFHPRFAAGGPVQSVPETEYDEEEQDADGGTLNARSFKEKATRDSLSAARELDIRHQDEQAGKDRGRPHEYETKPKDMWIQTPDDLGKDNVSPEDYLKPEDSDA